MKLRKVVSVFRKHLQETFGDDIELTTKKQFDNLSRQVWEELKQISDDIDEHGESDEEEDESDVDSDEELDMSDEVENALDELMIEWDVFDTFIRGKIEKRNLEELIGMKVKYDSDKEFKKDGFPISLSAKDNTLIVTFEHGDDETKKVKLREKDLSLDNKFILDFILNHM
jgi:hypothetical protein